MKYSVLRTIIDDTGTHVPGDVIEIQDKNEADRLASLKAVVPVIAEKSASLNTDAAEAINELMEIEGVTQDIAIELIKNGLDSINKIQNASVENITSLKIKNVGKATAEKIIAYAIENFEVED